MLEKYLYLLYKFDLFGITPQLRIFNFKSYNSIFSSIISIAILSISLGFAFFLVFDYSQFENPLVIYYKDNDEITNRTFLLKDTLLIFGLIDSSYSISINESEVFYDAYYYKIYFNGTYEQIQITLEPCEFGKNINRKFKDLLEKMELYNSYYNISEFYCISPEYGNLSISNLPNIGESGLQLFTVIRPNSSYIPENIYSIFYFESDIIGHNNKSNPVDYYFDMRMTPSYSSSYYTEISCGFQYIKYESDVGLIFKNNKIIDAKVFGNMFYNQYYMDYSIYDNNISSYIGMINIGIDNAYDHYKRIYTKLQSLIAEIMSTISLIFNIGSFICSFLLNKNMTKDIVYSLLNENTNEIENNNSSIQENKRIHQIFKDITEISSSSERNNMEKKFYIMSHLKSKMAKKNPEIINRKLDKAKIDKNMIKDINLCHIIKSYFCCKDKKTQLINNIYEFICQEMSIEEILKKIYDLEKKYHLHLKKEQIISFDNRFEEINKITSNTSNKSIINQNPKQGLNRTCNNSFKKDDSIKAIIK